MKSFTKGYGNEKGWEALSYNTTDSAPIEYNTIVNKDRINDITQTAKLSTVSALYSET